MGPRESRRCCSIIFQEDVAPSFFTHWESKSARTSSRIENSGRCLVGMEFPPQLSYLKASRPKILSKSQKKCRKMSETNWYNRSEGMSSRGISSLSAKRRGADWVQVFQCCRRRHPTLFFIKRVFRKSPEAKFRSGSLEKPPGSHIDHPKSIFPKKTKNPKNPQNQKNQKSSNSGRESKTRPETYSG